MSSYRGDGSTLSENVGSYDFFGRPRNPTPGSRFVLPTSAFTDSDVGGNGNVFGDQSISNGSTLRGVNDKQMRIAKQKAEKSMGGAFASKFPTSNFPFGISLDGSRSYEPLAQFSSSKSLAENPFLKTLGKSSFDFRVSGGDYGSSGSSAYSSFPSALRADDAGKTSFTLGGMGFDVDSSINDEDEMNTVTGFQSNGRIPGIQYTVYGAHNAEAPGKHDLVILEKNPVTSGHDNFFTDYMVDQGLLPQLQGYGRTFAPHNGFTLASFNYTIACLQIDKLQAGASIDAIEKQYNDHRNLINQYAIMGVCDSETFIAGGASYFLSDSQSKSVESQKSLNIGMEGETPMKNIYGPVQAGSKLWLIWKQIDRIDSYYIDTRRDKISLTLGDGTYTQQKTSNKIVKRPFQLVPWTDTYKDKPSLADLEFDVGHFDMTAASDYIPRWKRKRIGTAFYVGEVNHVPFSMSHSEDKNKAERLIRTTESISDYRSGSDEHIYVLLSPRIEGGNQIKFL